MRFPLRLDIVAIGDFRVADNAAPAHTAVLLALAEAGYRVGVLAVVADIPADPYALTPALDEAFLRGRLLRLTPGTPVDCALAIGFDGRVFQSRLLRLPAVHAAARVVTVDRTHPFAGAGQTALERLDAHAAEALGGPVVWAPSSNPPRAAVAAAAPHWRLTAADWPLVAPPVRAEVRRPERARPVIGLARIARLRPWPDSPERWAQHAPDDPLIAVRVLGAPNAPRAGLAARAGPIELWPRGSVALDAFLGKLDFLANADRVEADPCPVEALMALAAGVVPVLPPEFRPVFGPVAAYVKPAAIRRTVVDLFADPPALAELRAVARDVLRERHAPERFVARVRELAGPPRTDAILSRAAAQSPARVLMFSTNGVGMGHLARQLAVAQRLPKALTPVFLSHSQAVDVVRRYGYAGEHIPYHAGYGGAKPHWNENLAAVLAQIIGFYDPAALVFDGNVPFSGLIAALEDHPEVARIWIRRAMWGPHRDLHALDRSRHFDAIIEPGELAADYDEGPTVPRRSETRRVPPIRLLDPEELLDREEAAKELGLDPERTNALLLPGSGSNFDVDPLVAAACRKLAGTISGEVVIADWLISDPGRPWPAGARVIRSFPLMRWVRAFDFAISTASYNAFAELTAYGVPAIWIANDNPQMDRQDLRAEYAQRCGLGRRARTGFPNDLERAIAAMLESASRSRMAEKMARLPRDNGAGAAARIVADLALSATASGRCAAGSGMACPRG